MKIYIGCDHRGLKLKEKLIEYLEGQGISPIDVGAKQYDEKDDFNKYARALCKKVQSSRDSRGILICGSGVGMCMQANRFKGIRAVNGDSRDIVRTSRRHNDANVLTLGADFVSPTNAMIRTATFITTRFEGGHYQHRVDALDD